MEGNGVNFFRRFEDLYLVWVQRGIEKEKARNTELRANIDKLQEPLRELRRELGKRSLLLDRGGGRLFILGIAWVFIGGVISSVAHLGTNGSTAVIVIPFLSVYFAAILQTRAARQNSQSQQPEDSRGDVDSSALREMSSLKNILKANIGVLFVSVLILVGEIILAGPIYALVTLIIMMGASYLWLTRFHTPQYIHILLVKIKPSKKGRGSPVVVGYLHIPVHMFRFVETEGVAPSINDLRYGPGVYMAEDVEYDDYGFPKKIHFTWMQFPELEFMLKKEVYSILKEYTERLVLISDKQTELGKFLSIAAAREMTEKRFQTINDAKVSDYEDLERQKQNLFKGLTRLLDENKATLMGSSGLGSEESEDGYGEGYGEEPVEPTQ